MIEVAVVLVATLDQVDKPSELAAFLRCAIDGTPAACCRFARELDEQAHLDPAVRAKIRLYLRKCAPAVDRK
jgi:hypothetical protein